LLEELAELDPGAEAVIGGRTRLTYGEFRRQVDVVALGLLSRGSGKGDHIALMMGNTPEWLILWWAINRIGAVAVGVSTWSSPAELNYILRHSDARILFYQPSIGARNLGDIVDTCLADAGWRPTQNFAPKIPALREVIRITPDTAIASVLADSAVYHTPVPVEMLEALGREIRPADTALILYTSGSTSTPKGVQLIHRILIENGFDIGEGEKIKKGDKFWLSLPLFWSAGSANTAMATLTHNATVVLQEYFDPPEAVRLLREERCTHYFAFPNVTQAIFKELADAPRLPAARVAVSSGQPEILSMLTSMGFSTLLHPYGTTEDYGFATMTGIDETTESLTWSQGRPLPGIELKICDPESGAELDSGQPGEICMRGNITIGYYKDEDKNRAVFDDDGYFHTGDIAIQHADGRLQFLGRQAEMIKTSGFNVSPAEVEVVLLEFSGVTEAYVVGVTDERRGQAVIACIRSAGVSLSLEELRRHCVANLSSYKVPRAFLIMKQFPMTATGKISKVALKEFAETQVKLAAGQ